ncbi:YopT-type cysteine protease domain-containing protein [Falsiroseomonas sp. HW251]|uniref:YopT-type cysteine protease domain-containing protein n=1 Tax=Falsiroseomonas sp. HW251 TaxID=3390998 RepID=UPI003D320393
MSQTMNQPSKSDIALAEVLGGMGRKCLALGGVVIEASQDRDLGTFMRANPATAGGVCKALSLIWIGMHARETSFWDWLGTQGAINQVRAQSVMNTFLSYDVHVRNFPGGDGDAWKDKWALDLLKPYGVVAYTGVTGKRPARSGGKLYAVGNICDAINSLSDVYIQLSLGGRAGRHAVSFYAGHPDVAFYDPNYGEYWFPDSRALKPWLAEFMKVSRYDVALGDDWVMRNYKRGR